MSRSIRLHKNSGEPVCDYFMLMDTSGGVNGLGHNINKSLPEDKSAHCITACYCSGKGKCDHYENCKLSDTQFGGGGF